MLPHKPDPYCYFKSDAARERALRYRERVRAVTYVSVAALLILAHEDGLLLQALKQLPALWSGQ